MSLFVDTSDATTGASDLPANARKFLSRLESFRYVPVKVTRCNLTGFDDGIGFQVAPFALIKFEPSNAYLQRQTILLQFWTASDLPGNFFCDYLLSEVVSNGEISKCLLAETSDLVQRVDWSK